MMMTKMKKKETKQTKQTKQTKLLFSRKFFIKKFINIIKKDEKPDIKTICYKIH